MNKTRIVVALLALITVSNVGFAEHRVTIDRFEFGAHAGVGFYVAPRQPVEGNDAVYRIHTYDALYLRQGHGNTFEWPGIESFGGSVGYRIDTRWTLRAQATGQRLHFIETDANKIGTCNETYSCYNSLCHLDVIAEFNILDYVVKQLTSAGLYNVVPYVGLGIGMTFFNKDATIRSAIPGGSNLYESTTFPLVGSENKLTGNKSLGVAAYIPAVLGVKWRINDNVQLKGTFQYQIYLTRGNLEGGCPIGGETMNGVQIWDKEIKDFKTPINLDATGRPTYDKMSAGVYHDCLFSLGVIVNFGEWDEDLVRKNLDY